MLVSGPIDFQQYFLKTLLFWVYFGVSQKEMHTRLEWMTLGGLSL